MTEMPPGDQDDRNDQHDRSDADDRSEKDTTPPAMREVKGDEGFPGTLVDTDHNMPGDQPEDTTGPNKSDLEGKS